MKWLRGPSFGHPCRVTSNNSSVKQEKCFYFWAATKIALNDLNAWLSKSSAGRRMLWGQQRYTCVPRTHRAAAPIPTCPRIPPKTLMTSFWSLHANQVFIFSVTDTTLFYFTDEAWLLSKMFLIKDFTLLMLYVCIIPVSYLRRYCW